MSHYLSIDEILQIAVQIEENGARFYAEAARTVKDSSAGETFFKLSEFEKEHKKYFLFLKDNLTQVERETTTYDPYGESMQYLADIANNAVSGFKSPDKMLKKPALNDIIKSSIDMEKESIVFYTGLRQIISDKSGKEKLEEIVREEISHIAILNNVLKY